MNNLKLEEYPNTIAELERQLLSVTLQLNFQETTLETIIHTVDRDIVFDLELKNEQQRKVAKREGLEASQRYRLTLDKVDKLKREKEETTIELNRVKNLFSVVKLQARLRIAEMGVES